MQEFHRLLATSSALFFSSLFLAVLATVENPSTPLLLIYSSRVALFVAFLYLLYRLLFGIRHNAVLFAREGFRTVLYAMSWFSIAMIYGFVFLL